MAGLIEELSRRAAHAGAALAIYDGDDKIISVNRKHKELYPFVDFSSPIDFRHHFMECVKHKKFDESSVYKAPERWISFASRFRRLNRFSQTLTRHSDGRIIQVTFERIDGTNGRWYQMRRDVTAEVLQRIRSGMDPLTHIGSNEASPPPVQATFMVRLLDTFPQPAALLTTRSQVVDGNVAFANLLSRGDGLILTNGRLGLQTSFDAEKALSKCVAGFYRRRHRAPVTLRTAKLDRQSFYLLTLTEPPIGQLSWETTAAGILLLTVTDPKVVPAIEPRIIAELLQITEPEARVAQAFANGLTADEIAAKYEVPLQTIKNKTDSILRSTGFRDIAAVAQQVATLSYVFGPRI
ncbi:helix-turn-helix transcriptional regulator [Azospirillum thermophilum]|uniref:helix-turn-helix transcriptional regulator n=1 Tax=Azospirillum thermophilum TaxID=2202148 RepID=UPI0011B77A50|nr:LuxR family transcriptional regulator [Azospirillum thermophilum]